MGIEKIFSGDSILLNYLPEIKSEKDWLDYLNFLKNCYDIKPTEDIYTEIHHIVPQCFLPKNLKNSEENLIKLRARDHFIAHDLLEKALQHRATSAAFWRMVLSNGQNGNIDWITPERYEELKKRNALKEKEHISSLTWVKKDNKCKRVAKEDLDIFISEGWSLGRIYKMTEEGSKLKSEKIKNYYKTNPQRDRSGILNPFYGKKHSDTTKNQISISCKNYYKALPEETKKRMTSKTTEKIKGRVRVHKEGVEKSIPETSLKDYLKDNWIRGSLKSPNLGKIILHKDNKEKMVFPEDKDIWINQGWLIGRVPFTEEHIKNAKIGRTGAKKNV